MSWLSSRGDTLVEVVLSIAILSVVLVTSYTIANYDYRIGVQARERTEAINLAQQQAERLVAARDVAVAANPNPATAIFTGMHGNYYLDQNLAPHSCHPVAVTAFNQANGCPSGMRYQVWISSAFDAAHQQLNSTIHANWVSLIGTEANSTDFKMVVADLRTNNVRDCSVKGQGSCVYGP